MSERDPNTIWASSHRAKTFSSTGAADVDKSITEDYQGGNPTEICIKIHEETRKFWRKYSAEFEEFWKKMTTESRENFLREMNPYLVQNLHDRYCILNGKKTYENRYNTELLFRPNLTIDNLASGDNFPDLFKLWAQESALVGETSEIVVNFRLKHTREGWFPHNRAQLVEYRRQLEMRKGDHVHQNFPNAPFGTLVSMEKPDIVINSQRSGINLYRIGMVVHPVEFHFVVSCLTLPLLILANTVDEFREEILGKNGDYSKMVSKAFGCAQCRKTEGDNSKHLKACGKCKIVFYCSKECQAAHWKTKHKRECEMICRTDV